MIIDADILETQLMLREKASMIRAQIDGSRILCFNALLRELGETLAAESAGIICVSPLTGVATCERLIKIRDASNPGFDIVAVGRTLQKRNAEAVFDGLKTARSNIDQPGICFPLFFPNTDLQQGQRHGSCGWFYRVLPSSEWIQPKQAHYWAYIWNPALLPSRALGGDGKLEWEIMRVIAEWIAWKNSRLFFRAEQLERGALTPTDLATIARYSILRPFKVHHFAELISRIRPSETGYWHERARNTNNGIKAVYQLATGCSLPPTQTCIIQCAGVVHRSLCPQDDSLNYKLKTIGRLHLWRTGFWHDKNAQRKNSADLHGEAIQGLRDAVELLDRHQGMPLDLHHGRDRLLLRFFLARAIYQTVNDERFTQVFPQPAQMRLMARQARLAFLLLTKQAWTEDAIENLIHVMADYGHDLLHIPRKLKEKGGGRHFDLADHLGRTLRGESALYTLKAWYRDHFFHTIEVCLIGFALLRSHPMGKDSGSLSEHLTNLCNEGLKGRKKEKKISRIPNSHADFMAQWWVAALVHDTAYGIDVLEGTLKLLSDFSSNPGMTKFLKGVRDAVGQMAKDSVSAKLSRKDLELAKIAPELLKEIKDADGGITAKSESILKGDHGVISSSDLAQLLPTIGLGRDFSAAIRAIAFHNTRHPQISAAADPVAALLVLCDTIQDWGRSQLGFKHSPALVLSRLVSPSPTPKEDQFGPVERFSFDISPRKLAEDKPHCHDWTKQNQLVLQLDYNKKARDGYGIFYGWADLVYNLRRVSFADWRNIEIRVRQRYPIVDDTDIPMIDRFSHIANGDKTYAEFVKMAKQGDPAKAVCWNKMDADPTDGCKEWDVMEFNLTALAKEQDLLGHSLKAFTVPIERYEQSQEQARRVDDD